MTISRHNDDDEHGERIGGRESRIGMADVEAVINTSVMDWKSRTDVRVGHDAGLGGVKSVYLVWSGIWVRESSFPSEHQFDGQHSS